MNIIQNVLINGFRMKRDAQFVMKNRLSLKLGDGEAWSLR